MRTRFALGGTVALVVVAAGVAVLVATGARDVPALRPTAVLTVEGPLPGPPVPTGFLGFSTEYGAIPQYAHPVFVRLIRNLTDGQTTVLRIGGDSADKTWWPVAGMAQPPGVNYSLGSRWVEVARGLAGALRARLILGIDLEADSLELAGTEARELVSGLGAGNVEALELGNEPELYDSFPWYRADHHNVTGRPRNQYTLAAFISDFALFSSVMPSVRIAGPTIGGPGWLRHLSEFLGNEPQVKLVTVHRYPLQNCFVKASSPVYPTIGRLLAPSSSTGLAEGFAPFAAIAHARGLPIRIDELNSVSCGADRPVSYTFASALWALETMLEMARTGVDGVNIHTFPGAGYELLRMYAAGGRWRASVAPEYYGLALFSAAAPVGSRLLRVAVAGRAPVRAWATRGLDGRVRVVLVDADEAHAAVVAVRVPGARSRGVLERLRAPSLAARSGVTLGGQSFGPDGALTGRRHVFSVAPDRGRYVVRIPPAGAALLTIASSGTRSG